MLPDISATPLMSSEPPSNSPDAVTLTRPEIEPLVKVAVPSVIVGAVNVPPDAIVISSSA